MLNVSAKTKLKRRQDIHTMEENIQKMLNELKSEITGQIGDSRTNFQEFRAEIKRCFLPCLPLLQGCQCVYFRRRKMSVYQKPLKMWNRQLGLTSNQILKF